MSRVINLPADIVANNIINGIAPNATEAQETQAYRSEVTSSLAKIATLLQAILNHQRVITGIESSNEGDF